jgi:glycosyltransferase involved in cell wall biosynthesis
MQKIQTNKATIYFAFPDRRIGGCSILFLRVANYFQKNNLANCILIDYKDGYMSKENKILELVEYGENYITIPNFAILVTQSTPPWSIYKYIKFSNESRIFYWNCHPFNLIPSIPGFRKISTIPIIAYILKKSILKKYYSNIAAFLTYMNNSKSIVFMDGENLKTTEKYLKINLNDPKFIPIPVEIEINKWQRPKDKNIKVLWVGRIVDFKFYPLLNALIELNKLHDRNITVTIVGSGDYLNSLKKECTGLKKIKIKFVNEVDHKNIKDYMLNYNLVLAMGTTALESSSVGIPTLLLDPSYKKVKSSYRFRWLYESTNYDLGSFSYHDECNGLECSENSSLKKIINDLDNNSNLISSRCYEYADNNHNLNKVSMMLMDCICGSESTYKEALTFNFSQPDLIYKAVKFLNRKKNEFTIK